jgi:hypothetical protein
VIRAREQIDTIVEPNWDVQYDRGTDTMYLRRDGAGPAISYLSPKVPGLVFRLDVQTGELTGIDMEQFRSVMVALMPELKDVLKAISRARWASRFPGLRTLGQYALRGANSRTREQVLQRYCMNP